MCPRPYAYFPLPPPLVLFPPTLWISTRGRLLLLLLLAPPLARPQSLTGCQRLNLPHLSPRGV
ncbi:hypothetical protein E2C01_073480 [Portunus trituberculatus]|uniref:Uncharacterized protein n=1 Tax=Portunus trituberculatus TaxID=210409 RepID=A0A5B7I329_PORTR|nr:hypothetical protein [Portunus trituberculatus]